MREIKPRESSHDNNKHRRHSSIRREHRKERPYSSSKKDNIFPRERSNNSHQSSCNEQNYSESRTKINTLCIRKIPPSIDSDSVQEYLHNEFSPFGPVNIQVFKTHDLRIALINFKNSGDAKMAYKSKETVRIQDKSLTVEITDDEAFMRDLSNENFRSHQRHEKLNQDEHFQGIGNSDRNRRNQTSFSSRQSGSSNYRSSRSPLQSSRNSSRSNYSRMKLHKHHHESPEPENNDPKATRTLFVGSLEPDIGDNEVREVFERYGIIEQIDVKRPNTSHAYAFVRFATVAMALKAKTEMSGNCVRSYHCKIGFGKPIQSNSIFISGLENWQTREELERLLLCFGPLLSLDWQHKKQFAVAVFQTQEIADEASKQLKLLSIRRPEVKLIIDFVDPESFLHDAERQPEQPNNLRQSLLPLASSNFALCNNLVSANLIGQNTSSGLRFPLQFPNSLDNSLDPMCQSHLLNSSSIEKSLLFNSANQKHRINAESYESNENRQRRAHQLDQQRYVRAPQCLQKYSKGSHYKGLSPIGSNNQSDSSPRDSYNSIISHIVTMQELDVFLQPVIWTGQIYTKKSIFRFRCLHAIGNLELSKKMSTFQTDVQKSDNDILPEENVVNFHMNVQVETDATWMVEAVHRINLALSEKPPSFSVLLALPDLQPEQTVNSSIQETDNKNENSEEALANNEISKASVIRPLTCLTAYLRFKKRAGFLTRFSKKNNNKIEDDISDNYASLLLTPSSFALNLLKFAAPRLSSELAVVDDFLVLVVLRK